MLLFQPNTAQGKLNAVIIPTRPTGFHCSRSVWPGPNIKITLSNSILSRIGMTNQTGCPREAGGLLQILSDRNGRVGFEIFNARIFEYNLVGIFLGGLI